MSMERIFITGTGFYLPNESISNEELVNSYNNYANIFNLKHMKEIEAGLISRLDNSDSDFIETASGVKNRYVIDKTGILNPELMRPSLKSRVNSEKSLQCEMSVKAAVKALDNANKKASDINGVIVACSNMQRPYPAIAIEVQKELNITGWGYDLNAACSSAVFGITAAIGAIKSGNADSVIVVSPEIYTGHLNFRDRKSHFIFGDGCSATIIDRSHYKSQHPYEILSGKLTTNFSNNIRNNRGFLNRCEDNNHEGADKLFVQEGRRVREEVIPMVVAHINSHLSEQKINKIDIKRLWLHQANINMNRSIAKLVLDREPKYLEAPIILQDYGNTGAAGVMITFNKFHTDLLSGDLGIICSFGAGYSAGSILCRKV